VSKISDVETVESVGAGEEMRDEKKGKLRFK
jgi:hypothetical protein